MAHERKNLNNSGREVTSERNSRGLQTNDISENSTRVSEIELREKESTSSGAFDVGTSGETPLR